MADTLVFLDTTTVCHAIARCIFATQIYFACHVDVVRTSRSQQPKDPHPAGVVKFRSDFAFVHAEKSAHSVTPGNFGLSLSCDNLLLETIPIRHGRSWCQCFWPTTEESSMQSMSDFQSCLWAREASLPSLSSTRARRRVRVQRRAVQEEEDS